MLERKRGSDSAVGGKAGGYTFVSLSSTISDVMFCGQAPCLNHLFAQSSHSTLCDNLRHNTKKYVPVSDHAGQNLL